MDEARIEELRRQIEEHKKRQQYLRELREKRIEEERKRRENRAVFDALFPEFKDVPVIWVLIGIGCVVFSLFGLII